jgi:hypothetical protein
MFSACILVLPEERAQRPVKQSSAVPSCRALQICCWYPFYYYDYYYFIAVVKITIAVIVIITLSSLRRRLLVIIIVIIAFTPHYRISFHMPESNISLMFIT